MGSTEEAVQYGRRLVPVTIDETARDTPGRTFAIIPRSDSFKDGFINVSFHELARAVNRTAQWIEGTLGRGKDFETLAYIAPSDLKYVILMVAACKARYKVLYSLN